MNDTQVSVLRNQFARLTTDGEIVAFYEDNHSEVEQVEELVEKARAAFDRLEAKKAKEAKAQVVEQEEAGEAKEKSEVEANAERRTKIAAIFAAKGFDEAAVAIEQELEVADAKTLSDIVKVLDSAIPEAKLYGWAKHYAYIHRNSAKQALDAMAEGTATKLFIWLSAVIGRALRALDLVKSARSDTFKAGLVRQAQERVEEANGIRFQGWALAALERLMAGHDNPVVEALRTDRELAGTVGAAADGKKAVALINALKERVEKRIAAVHVGPMRPGKTAREHEKDRDNRKVERSAADAAYRNSMKGHNPSADKHGRRK